MVSLRFYMFIVVGLIFVHMFQNHFLFIVNLGNSVEILLVRDFNKAFYSVLFYNKKSSHLRRQIRQSFSYHESNYCS